MKDQTCFLKVKPTQNTTVAFSFLNCCGFNWDFGGFVQLALQRLSKEEGKAGTGNTNNSSQPHTHTHTHSDVLGTKAGQR